MYLICFILVEAQTCFCAKIASMMDMFASGMEIISGSGSGSGDEMMNITGMHCS